MKQLFTLPLALLCFTGILGCEMMGSGTEQQVSAYIPTFHYTPSAQAQPGSAGVTFAIVHAVYKSGGKEDWLSYKQFGTLPRAMGENFHEILTAKGFTTRGPFATYDEISFPDKKGCDLLLIPAVELLATTKDEKTSFVPGIIGANSYNVTGNVVVKGRLNLELRETLTRELMWSKTIVIPEFEVPYKVNTQAAQAQINPFQYDAILNEVARGMERQYTNLMATAEKYLEPEEMQMVKKQAQELKDKKGY